MFTNGLDEADFPYYSYSQERTILVKLKKHIFIKYKIALSERNNYDRKGIW